MVFSLKNTQKKAAAAPEEKLFTQGADPALAAIVKDIRGKHARFATDFMGIAEAGQRAVRDEGLVAWQIPGSVLFRVDKISRFLPPGDTIPFVRKEDFIADGICFFDALHLLSSCQSGAEAAGQTAFPTEDGEPVHWRDAARAAGQSVDMHGIVQPCADRRVLTNGAYFKDEKELHVAAQSAPSFNLRTLKPGDPAGNRGIFLCFYDPEDDTVSETPNESHMIALFTAPTDVKKKDGRTNLELTFNKMAEHVARLSDWHGHDGAKFKEGFLSAFFSSSSYEESLKKHLLKLKEGEGTGWFIGTKAVLEGQGHHMDEGAFYKTYMPSTHYWSCTERGDNVFAGIPNKHRGAVGSSFGADYTEEPARPVRAERIKP